MMLSEPPRFFRRVNRDGVVPQRPRRSATTEGLDAKMGFIWLQLEGGDISLDIPFYRTEGL